MAVGVGTVLCSVELRGAPRAGTCRNYGVTLGALSSASARGKAKSMLLKPLPSPGAKLRKTWLFIKTSQGESEISKHFFTPPQFLSEKPTPCDCFYLFRVANLADQTVKWWLFLLVAALTEIQKATACLAAVAREHQVFVRSIINTPCWRLQEWFLLQPGIPGEGRDAVCWHAPGRALPAEP